MLELATFTNKSFSNIRMRSSVLSKEETLLDPSNTASLLNPKALEGWSDSPRKTVPGTLHASTLETSDFACDGKPSELLGKKSRRKMVTQVEAIQDLRLNTHVLVKYFNGKWYGARVVSYNKGDSHLKVTYDGSSFGGKISTGEQHTVSIHDIKMERRTENNKLLSKEMKSKQTHTQNFSRSLKRSSKVSQNVEEGQYCYFYPSLMHEESCIPKIGKIIRIHKVPEQSHEISATILPLEMKQWRYMHRSHFFPTVSRNAGAEALEVPLSLVYASNQPKILNKVGISKVFVLSAI